MLKNKINVLVVIFLFSVVCRNSYAMDEWGWAIVPVLQYDQDEPILSDVVVKIPVLVPKIPIVAQELVWDFVESGIVKDYWSAYWPNNTCREVARLRLVNKETNEYLKRDDVLHDITMKIVAFNRKKHLHPGDVRALIEGLKTKRVQHRLYKCVYEGDMDNFAALGLDEIDSHKLDQRYYYNPDCFRQYCCAWNLVQNDGLALVNICKKKEAHFPELQKCLLALPGISERARDNDGITALMWSIEVDSDDQKKPFNIFLQQAAKGICVGVNLQDKNGDTALMRVAKKLKKMGYFTEWIRLYSSTEKEDRLNLKLQSYLIDLMSMGSDFYIPDNECVKPYDVICDISPKLAASCKAQYDFHRLRLTYLTSPNPEEFLLGLANDIIERS
jgi:hypothetical protein